MAAIKRDYLPFYLAGREEPVRALRNRMEESGKSVDDLLDDIDQQEEVDVPAAIRKACEEFVERDVRALQRKKWMREHADDLGDVDGVKIDADEAYQAWCWGVTDLLASKIEADVIEAMFVDDPEDD